MLSVFFATRNGAAVLPRVLEAFSNLQDPGGWKLVVIDNGSDDNTPQILKAFRGRLPLLAMTEREPGKNAALNTGLGELEGDLAVLSDDDVLPRRDWLVRLRQTADAHPEYSIFGGAILPYWEAPEPEWLSWVDQGPVFALTDKELGEGPVGPERVFGPNMAIRADIFRQGIRFDPTIGPKGANYAMGSETELTRRLAGLGHRCWHAKTAVVQHIIRASQMEKSWVLGRGIRFGRGQFRAQRWPTPKLVKMGLSMPSYIRLKMAAHRIPELTARVRGNEEASFRANWQLQILAGHLIEAEAAQARHGD